MRASASIPTRIRRRTRSMSGHPGCPSRSRSHARCISNRPSSIARRCSWASPNATTIALSPTWPNSADEEREAAARERAELARARAELEARAAALEAERRSLLQHAQERLTERLREFSRQLEERHHRGRAGRVTRAQSELLARTIEQMRRELGLDHGAERPLQGGAVGVGDRVRVASLDQEGTVVEDYGDTAAVGLGAMRLVVPKAELVRCAGPTPKARVTAATGEAEFSASRAATSELDVRGKRFAEAQPLVEQWLDRAILAGFSQPLRLIHGKGSGTLGRGLQEFLRSHPGVKSVRYGNADEGEGGVTIVELADS